MIGRTYEVVVGKLPVGINVLRREALAEGYQWLAADWKSHMIRFDRPGVLLAARVNGALVGVGGLTIDQRMEFADGSAQVVRRGADLLHNKSSDPRNRQRAFARGRRRVDLEPIVLNAMRIRRLYVRPAFRRRGIGYQLVAALLARGMPDHGECGPCKLFLLGVDRVYARPSARAYTHLNALTRSELSHFSML
jgi:GNAT superfamily N-acetyltransferase